VSVLPLTRKTMRPLASPFPLARLSRRQRVEEVFTFVKTACGAVRPTHRAAQTRPIDVLGCVLASSLSQVLSARTLSPGIAYATSTVSMSVARSPSRRG
jgi:hypothetical protein